MLTADQAIQVIEKDWGKARLVLRITIYPYRKSEYSALFGKSKQKIFSMDIELK